MEGVLLFVALAYLCSHLNRQDFEERNRKYDPYLLERGWMLEEDAEHLYSTMIRRHK